jgi:hypothetical protein
MESIIYEHRADTGGIFVQPSWPGRADRIQGNRSAFNYLEHTGDVPACAGTNRITRNVLLEKQSAIGLLLTYPRSVVETKEPLLDTGAFCDGVLRSTLRKPRSINSGVEKCIFGHTRYGLVHKAWWQIP